MVVFLIPPRYRNTVIVNKQPLGSLSCGKRRWFLSLGLLLSITASGCSSRGARSCHITGTVSIDDKPVVVGQISFDITVEGDVSSSGPISQGKYDLWVSPGKKIVRISAVDMSSVLETTTEDGFVTTIGTAKDLVPAKYSKEPLEVEIDSSGTRDFALTSD